MYIQHHHHEKRLQIHTLKNQMRKLAEEIALTGFGLQDEEDRWGGGALVCVCGGGEVYHQIKSRIDWKHHHRFFKAELRDSGLKLGE